MTENPFAKFVPGFDFMQGLVKNAGSALPGFGQWVAPTLDPDALGKRIDELRAVQFWLDQNAKMLSTTIQALEVQRMTLSTLKSMNVPMADLGESLKVKPAAPPAPSAPAAAKTTARPRTRSTGPAEKPQAAKPEAGPSAIPPVDPMKWWGALSQQFTELATNAMKDVAPVASQAAAAMAGQTVGAPAKTAARKRKT